MVWLARPKLPVAVAAALVLATVGVAVQGRQQPAAEKAREQAGAVAPDVPANQALAREQLALIDKAEETLRLLAQNGRISLRDAQLSLWSRRRIESLRNTGAGKAEIVAALEKYVEFLKQDEAIAQGMRERAQATMVEVYDAQYRRMEAEIWLNEAKAR